LDDSLLRPLSRYVFVVADDATAGAGQPLGDVATGASLLGKIPRLALSLRKPPGLASAVRLIR